MKVRELIDLLERFEPTAEVRLCVNWPDRVAETYERIWVGDYGGGPRINAAVDFRGVEVYVGCVLEQRMPTPAPRRPGPVRQRRTAARVARFLRFPPRAGRAAELPRLRLRQVDPAANPLRRDNGLIAEILKEKLLATTLEAR